MAKGKKTKEEKEKKKNSDAPVTQAQDKVLMVQTKEKTPATVHSEAFINDAADFFKVFGDSTRLKILHLLLKEELCVGDIAQKLSMTQSAVSHQLRVLRQSDLVKYRKEGKTVIYSLDDEHVTVVLESGMSHISHKKGYE